MIKTLIIHKFTEVYHFYLSLTKLNSIVFNVHFVFMNICLKLIYVHEDLKGMPFD